MYIYIYFLLFTSNRNFSFIQIKSKQFVLSKNILAGDALTMKTSDGVKDLLLSEWSFTKGSKVKRIEYSLSNILAYQPFDGDSLFSDLGDQVIIPKPTKIHPQINFLDLKDEI